MELPDIATLRREYASAPLDEDTLDPDAIVAFRAWLDDALRANIDDANAMVLATADAYGVPSARSVLLKAVDERGFTFYTNQLSRKAEELAANPRAALVFRWRVLERQVTAKGPVSRLHDEEADAYWTTRPRATQVGAWASQQSSVLDSRQTLEDAAAQIEARFPDEVPRPDFWGGYLVAPMEVELWQGRPNRLHDRIRYRRTSVGRPWTIERLAP